MEFDTLYGRLWSCYTVLIILLTDGGRGQTPTSEATTSEPCVNTISTCYHHPREEICQGIYKPWASVRCALYCGFCQGEDVCEDKIPNCYQYQPCDNPAFFVWVADNCLQYCNRCGPNATTTATPPTTVTQVNPQLTTASQISTQNPPATSEGSATCEDNLPFCSTYSPSACQENPDWARDYCPRYCKLCYSPLGTSTTVTSAPSTTVMSASSTTSTPSDASTTTAAGSSSTCRDYLTFCHVYSQSACRDLNWAHTYCAQYCGSCP